MFKGPAKPKGPSAHLTQMFGTSLLDATGKSVDTASVIKSSSENFLRCPRQSRRKIQRIWAQLALILVFQTLDSKVVAIYFGAKFCQHCEQFKPNLLTVRFRMCVCAPDHSAIFTNLLQAYNEIKAAGHPFEVLFASSDLDQSEFNSNSKSMPWMKLPYADPKDLNSTAQLLFSKFALKGYPSLVVLDQAGKLCLLIDISPMTFIRSSHFQ